MKFEDAKLVYQFFEVDYELHQEVASFSNEKAAIEFGVLNLVQNRGKRVHKLDLYNLEISVLYDAVSSYEEHSFEFWEQFNTNYKRIEKEIGERYHQLYKKEK
jgi:hypothetical protein